MPFARIDLIKEKSANNRETIDDIVYQAIQDVLKAPMDDLFMGIAGHQAADKLHVQLKLRREDAFTTLVGTGRDDWSFGGGVASLDSDR